MKTVVFRPPENHRLSSLAGCKGKIINTRGRVAWIRLEARYGQRGGVVLLTDKEYLKDD